MRTFQFKACGLIIIIQTHKAIQISNAEYIANSHDVPIKAINASGVDSSCICVENVFLFFFLICYAPILYSPYYFALWVFSIYQVITEKERGQ